ncbi:hypothetical protein VP02_00835 [Pseudomonas ogarae]|uniref:Uncharacterized protein n=1 Tax=Pseudomonas kilonensis TaxID=132476 RepID=A0A0F4XVH4_9PSED|nr:hypothetical protein VP02_00835 [Pseudomonas ogarae]
MEIQIVRPAVLVRAQSAIKVVLPLPAAAQSKRSLTSRESTLFISDVRRMWLLGFRGSWGRLVSGGGDAGIMGLLIS